MHIYRLTSGHRSFYLIPPGHTEELCNKYVPQLLAETNFPERTGVTRNISHLKTCNGADIIIDALQAQNWQPTHNFSIPPALMEHPALLTDADIATSQWSVAEVPPNFLILLEAVAVRQQAPPPRRRHPPRKTFQLGAPGVLLLVLVLVLVQKWA